MTERIEAFRETIGRYDEISEADRQQAIQELSSRHPSDARKQQIQERNEARITSSEGTPPAAIFEEEDAAICKAFIDHMRTKDFPASELLENKTDYGNPVRAFFHRVFDRDEPQPFAIRGYRIGTVSANDLDLHLNNSDQSVFLCEDGQLRAYYYSRVFRPAEDGAYRWQIANLPLDSLTGEIRQVRFGYERSNEGWGQPSEYKGVERMLESSLMEARHSELEQIGAAANV